jgi:hypothetical protein
MKGNARGRRKLDVVSEDAEQPRNGWARRVVVCRTGKLAGRAMLHRIRSEKQIRPSVNRCPRCGHVREAAEPDVAVRAIVLSLARFAIAPAEEEKTLEKRWAACRKQNWLDLYAQTAEPPRTDDPACAH